MSTCLLPYRIFLVATVCVMVGASEEVREYAMTVSPQDASVNTPYVVREKPSIHKVNVTPVGATFVPKSGSITAMETKQHSGSTWIITENTDALCQAKSPPIPEYHSSFVAFSGKFVVEGGTGNDGEPGDPPTWDARLTEPPSRIILAHQYPGDEANPFIVAGAKRQRDSHYGQGGVYLVVVGSTKESHVTTMAGVEGVLKSMDVSPKWVKWVDSVGHSTGDLTVDLDPEHLDETSEPIIDPKNQVEIGYIWYDTYETTTDTGNYILTGAAPLPAGITPDPEDGIVGHPVVAEHGNRITGGANLASISYTAYTHPTVPFLEQREKDPVRKKPQKIGHEEWDWSALGVWTLWHCWSGAPGTRVVKRHITTTIWHHADGEPEQQGEATTEADPTWEIQEIELPSPVDLVGGVLGEHWKGFGSTREARFGTDGLGWK